MAESDFSTANKMLEHILFPAEAEAIVENLRCTSLEEVGSSAWHEQHRNLEKLNMQAYINATLQSDEFIKDLLISHDKVTLLIHELLLVELWKEKIFLSYTKTQFDPKASFPCYIILYHEGTILNLLETILYYKETSEVIGEVSCDIIEYCYRKLTKFLADIEAYREDFAIESLQMETQEAIDKLLEKSSQPVKELLSQYRHIEFEIATRCISVLRYMTENLSIVPLLTTRLVLNILDIPLMMVEIIEKSPWTQRRGDKLFKYWKGKWRLVPEADQIKLSQTEAQIWLILIHLFLDRDCASKYEYNDYKKNSILRLRAHIPEYLLDQLPALVELQRYLHHLSIMEPPPPKKDLLIEAESNIKYEFSKLYKGKYKSIADAQYEEIFFPNKEQLDSYAKKWVDMYDLDVIHALTEGTPKCSECGGGAEKRCSRCKHEWYCSRKCQVKHWPKHKSFCTIIRNNDDDDDDDDDNNNNDNNNNNNNNNNIKNTE